MKLLHVTTAILFVTVFATSTAAQVSTITIEAGSPEDQALKTISQEQDTAKRMEMLKDFVQKFGSNPSAVADGYSQLSQLAQAEGKLPDALAYGDKALAAMPNNLELIVSQTNLAQQTKDYSRVVDYAARGGKAVNGTENKSPERERVQPSYEYLEATAISAISSETDPKQTLSDIEKFSAAFPQSRFRDSAAQYAVIALQQMNDMARLVAFGEKALASDPDNLPLLSTMANLLAEDPKGTYLGRSIEYARKAIKLSETDAPDPNGSRKLAGGLAHSALGFALLKQEKTLPAITELKAASGMVQSDAVAYSTVLYRLGFAYAKLKRYGEAHEVLAKAVDVKGPFQQPSRDLLTKVNAAVKK